jgi:3'(2'), 5'-bisphosphate nucleotidase
MLEKLLFLSLEAAVEAGKETLKYYNKEFTVDYKSDDSPLTQADLDSNSKINEYLRYTGIPILSEENTIVEFNERNKWEYLWVIDPVDGTKEFIKNRGEYTVNIALVHHNKPVMGVIYAPVTKELFFGCEGIGAFKITDASQITEFGSHLLKTALSLPSNSDREELIIVASKSHRNTDTENFIQNISSMWPNTSTASYGSSLKLCYLAEGKADIYPRLGPTMEWDTAAGHAIIEAAGFSILAYPNMTAMRYNKENLLNPYFIAFNPKYKKYLPG